MSRFSVRLVVAGLLAMLAAACGRPEPDSERSPVPVLAPVAFEALAGWADDAVGEALPALRRSCAAFARAPADRPIGPAGLAGTAGNWAEPCRAAQALDTGDHDAGRRFFERWFQPVAVSDGVSDRGLFTGYYEPELNGALAPDDTYATPLYALPGDIADGVPYYSRAEIEAGVLAGRGLELVWVDDPVDAFFLHIQGSGRVALADGRQLRLGYAGKNGHGYLAIGRVLVDQGALAQEEVSMQSIRDWLAANPARAQEIMNRNRSYVFFRVLDGDGPVGSQGVALTPERSIAVDRDLLPLGVPVWLDIEVPVAFEPDAVRPWRRLVVAQDTGGAIDGPVRADIFWGAGAAAADIAGRMRHRGRYYLLLPRTVALPD